MEDKFRAECESAILHSRTFGDEPDWHFVFIENPEILASLLELIPGMEAVRGSDALLGFAKRGSFETQADVASALYRVFCIAEETPCAYSEPLTLYFNIPEGQKLAAAFGVPHGYSCVGALLFPGNETIASEPEAKWNVFSYIR